jgi:hypothetical protein
MPPAGLQGWRPAGATAARLDRRAGPAHPVLSLQRAIGNRATAQLLARQERRPSWWMPSSPTVDIAALRMNQAFVSSSRSLTDRERGVARPVFGDSVDLDRVRIGLTNVLAAPTTLGNLIRVKGTISDDTLVHELTHVWQYQTSGLHYISCALAGQAEGTVLHGGRDWTYQFDPSHHGTHLADYGPEQQAEIVQVAFLTNQLDDPNFYGPLVAEVRRARPRPEDPGFDIDEAAGVTNPATRIPYGAVGAPDPRSEEMGGNVPQLQWRF